MVYLSFIAFKLLSGSKRYLLEKCYIPKIKIYFLYIKCYKNVRNRIGKLCRISNRIFKYKMVSFNYDAYIKHCQSKTL